MAPSSAMLKTSFAPAKVIQPFYTGGKVALDREGCLLVTTLDTDVLVTHLETGAELARITGVEDDDVTTLALTPQASYLIICSKSYLMRIYALSADLSSSPPTLTASLVRSTKAHTAPVIVAETDPTGTLLATGGADGLVKVWDIKGGYTTHNFRGHGGVISALKFFAPPSGTALSVPTEAERRNRKGGKKARVEIEPGTAWMLASGADDTRVRVWDLARSECVAVLEHHNSVVRGLDWSESGRTLVSGSRDKAICVWDAGKWTLKYSTVVFEELETVGFLAPRALAGEDGSGPEQVVYAGGKRNRVRLWDIGTGKELTEDGSEPEEENEELGIADIIYHKSLDFLVSVHNDQTILLHKLTLPSSSTSLPITRRLSGHHDEIIDLAYVGPDSSLLALATNSESVRIVSVDPSHGFGDAGVLAGHSDIVLCLDRDWSGTWLATGSKDNDARLWRVSSSSSPPSSPTPSTASFTCHNAFVGHAESIGALALPRSTPPADSAAYTEQRAPKFLLTGSQDRTIKRWDPKNPKRAVYTRKAHDKDINALDVSPDDVLFASASQDRTVKIWTVEDGATIGVLRGHRRGVWSVRFAPTSVTAAAVGGTEGSKGGRLVATSSGDRTVKLWSLADYSCVRTFEGHTNSVLKTVFLSAGQQVVSAGADGLVKVWGVRSGECDATLDNHSSKVWALAVREDEKQEKEKEEVEVEGAREDAEAEEGGSVVLVSGGADSVVTFWADTTRATAVAAANDERRLLEQEQALENYIHAADYRRAITLALGLNHPGRLLSLLTAVAEQGEAERSEAKQGEAPTSSYSGSPAVDEVLASLDDAQLTTLLYRIRDWNTNARTAPVAQRTLHALLRSYPPERLAALRPVRGGVKAGGAGGAGGAMAALWDALASYTDRHYRRLDELAAECFVVEYTLREMEDLVGGGEFADMAEEGTVQVADMEADVA